MQLRPQECSSGCSPVLDRGPVTEPLRRALVGVSHFELMLVNSERLPGNSELGSSACRSRDPATALCQRSFNGFFFARSALCPFRFTENKHRRIHWRQRQIENLPIADCAIQNLSRSCRVRVNGSSPALSNSLPTQRSTESIADSKTAPANCEFDPSRLPCEIFSTQAHERGF